MFPKRNDPCRPSSWEDPDDDYDPGSDLYDDELLAAETRILAELKAEPDSVDMSEESCRNSHESTRWRMSAIMTSGWRDLNP